MKLVSFRWRDRDSYGVVADGGVIDLGPRLGARYPDLKSVLAAGALDEVTDATKGQTADVALDDIAFLPVIPNPSKILCVGLNYRAHREEAGRKETDHPAIFIRFADSQLGHQQPVVRPRVSDRLDFEGELAVIIGKSGRAIEPEDALGHIAGYSCYLDASVRDWQRHTGQWTPGKNFPATGGFGPWMVTADEIPDPSRLTLTTRLNGEVMQQAGTDLLIFPLPVIIHYISSFTALSPGDVIATGTPGGVGSRRDPPVYMKPGDRIEVEITGIGTLAHPIAGE